MTSKIPLGALDAAFLFGETRNTPMHVASLQTFRIPSGAPPHFVSELYAYMRGFPVSAEPFNYQVAGGLRGKLRPSWEIRDDIDLDYHLRFSALPYPGGERELGILVSRLHSIPMDLSRPLWEVHLIEGLEDNRFAFYYKMHHALVDGMTAMRLVTLSNDRADGFAPPIWAARLGEKFAHRPSQTGLLEKLPELARKELEALPDLYRGLSAVAKAAVGMGGDANLTSTTESPRTLFNVKIDGQRRVATYRTSLTRLKTIGRAAGGTVNDVVLAACSGALRRYLAELGELPGKSLIGAVPVALFRDKREGSGNAVTTLLARLGTDVADVRERFGVILRSVEAGKEHLQDMSEAAAMNYTMMMATPAMLTMWLPDVATQMPPMYNLIISNVPGPRDTIRFHGAEMEAIYPVSQVGHGMALNITVVSYTDQFAFGFVACRDTVPSMQRLAVYMAEALDELEKTFLPKGKVTPAKSAGSTRRQAKPAGKPKKKSSKKKAAGKAEVTTPKRGRKRPTVKAAKKKAARRGKKPAA